MPPISFRDNDEINLWNQWVTVFSQRFDAEEAVAEADRNLVAFRERMKGIILQHKPGRA